MRVTMTTFLLHQDFALFVILRFPIKLRFLTNKSVFALEVVNLLQAENLKK